MVPNFLHFKGLHNCK